MNMYSSWLPVIQAHLKNDISWNLPSSCRLPNQKDDFYLSFGENKNIKRVISQDGKT